jgi:5-methylcytosine-specific restriction endonuclease McrA
MSSNEGYRRRALKILPWVCARCGRSFTGKKLHQLTVHHKDPDHTNTPADGSNWELLCIYCHDDEHSRREVAEAYGAPATGRKTEPSTYKPFADLDKLLKGKK